MSDEFTPKTEAGRQALENGADPDVVRDQEEAGELVDDESTEQPEHVESAPKDEDNPDDKGEGDPDSGEEGGEEGKDDEKDEDENPQPDRQAKSVPYWKHKEELKKLEATLETKFKTELEAAVSAASQRDGGASDEDIAGIAEEFNLDPAVAAKMIDKMSSIIEKRAGLPDIRKNVQESQEATQKAKEEDGFRNEWENKATQEALAAAANGAEVTAEVREKVKELAYRSDYTKYRLADIIRLEAGNLFGEPKKAVKTAEASRGGTAVARTKAKSLDDLTPEEIDALPDDEFLALSEELGGGQSRFTKTEKAPKKA